MTAAGVILGGAGLVVPAALLDAAWSDGRRYRIPDRDSIALVIAFIAWTAAGLWAHGWNGAAWSALGGHATAGLAAFIVGAVLFALGLWGGGDAKLLAAMAVWTGFAGLPRLVLVMAIAGGVLAVVLLAWRRLPFGKTAGPKVEDGGAAGAGGYLPYGVAIALAGLDWWSSAVLPRLGW